MALTVQQLAVYQNTFKTKSDAFLAAQAEFTLRQDIVDDLNRQINFHMAKTPPDTVNADIVRTQLTDAVGKRDKAKVDVTQAKAEMDTAKSELDNAILSLNDTQRDDLNAQNNIDIARAQADKAAAEAAAAKTQADAAAADFATNKTKMLLYAGIGIAVLIVGTVLFLIINKKTHPKV